LRKDFQSKLLNEKINLFPSSFHPPDTRFLEFHQTPIKNLPLACCLARLTNPQPINLGLTWSGGKIPWVFRNLWEFCIYGYEKILLK